MKPLRKLHIKSYGCQMNVYDAQRMVDTLAGEGFVETANAEEADLVGEHGDDLRGGEALLRGAGGFAELTGGAGDLVGGVGRVLHRDLLTFCAALRR